MKPFSIIRFTLALLLSAAVLFPSPMFRALNWTQPSGASNITADLWQTFEGALTQGGLQDNDHHGSALWTVSGAGKSVDAASQFTLLSTVNSLTDTGAQGLLVDNNTGTGEVKLDLNISFPYPTTQSVGFEFEISTLTDGTYTFPYVIGETGGSGGAIIRVKVSRSGSTYSLYLNEPTTPTDSGAVVISTGTRYKVRIKVVSGGTCLLRVYDAAGALIGSEQSVTGGNFRTDYHQFLAQSASSTGVYRLDNFLVDYTTATFPLGP